MAAMSANVVKAQDFPFAKPDRNGDYFSNYAPMRGQVRKNTSNMAGSLWQVHSPGLNCRSQPDVKSPIIQQFKIGTILQADVGRGGSDEVLINGTDSQGKPWMSVRSQAGENYNCYVRANKRYIKPYRV